jgi:hypothetical protein
VKEDSRSPIRKFLTEAAVYPLLVVNLALGFLMFAVSHQFLLVLSSWLYRDGGLDNLELGPSTYVQRSVSGFGAVILGLLGLIGFSLLESYFSRSAEQGGSLLFWRFLRIGGIQLLFLGVVQLATRLIVGIGSDLGMILIITQGLVGIGLEVFTRQKPRKSDDAAQC